MGKMTADGGEEALRPLVGMLGAVPVERMGSVDLGGRRPLVGWRRPSEPRGRGPGWEEEEGFDR